MRFKIPILFTMVLALLFVCNYANAAERFEPDVGGEKSFVKTLLSDNGNPHQLFSPAAFEPSPAFIRPEFVKDLHKQPKTEEGFIWNARICYNYPFQLPGRYSPFKPSPLRE